MDPEYFSEGCLSLMKGKYYLIMRTATQKIQGLVGD